MTPPTWHVPREWDNERCFILCSGESIGPQAETIKKLKGRFIGVKHGVLLRPDADVLFLSGEAFADVCLPLIAKFTGKYVVVRSKWSPLLPDSAKRVTRPKIHDKLCELTDHVAGLDCGTSSIDLAHKLGATEIIMLGYDMQGGHFCPHPLQNPPKAHFTRHMECLEKLNEDAKSKGIRIINCSPNSAVTAFEKRPLEEFL